MVLFNPTVLMVVVSFILAGSVKGLTGMGLPTVAIGLLGLVMPPVEAASLLVIPSLVTNVWQYVAGAHRLAMIRRLWPMLLAAGVATWLSAGLIAAGGLRANLALGVALAAYALVGLAHVQFSVASRAEPWLSPIIGAITGIMTGATGVFVIPAVPYLQALQLEKDDLVQALGLSFTASTLGLAAGLARYGAFHLSAIGASVVCTLPALLGMFVGGRLRARVDPPTFRRVFLIGLLILGADLALRA